MDRVDLKLKVRYHLYISLGCPWAHRTAILWKLKGLETIGLSIVNQSSAEAGLAIFRLSGVYAHTVNQADYLASVCQV